MIVEVIVHADDGGAGIDVVGNRWVVGSERVSHSHDRPVNFFDEFALQVDSLIAEEKYAHGKSCKGVADDYR